MMRAHFALSSVALLWVAGCAEWQYRTTDGRSWPGGVVFENAQAEWVVTHSAEHDFSCANNRIISEGSSSQDWIVEACGTRATYRFVAQGHTWQPLMVSRVAMNECSVDCGPLAGAPAHQP
jgi:hypothetical protein